MLEAYRPPDKLAYYEAVLAYESSEDLDEAGEDAEWVFHLEPIGMAHRHDLTWSSAALRAFDEEQQEEELARLAKLYWTGAPSHDPLWVWLLEAARVVAVERF